MTRRLWQWLAEQWDRRVTCRLSNDLGGEDE